MNEEEIELNNPQFDKDKFIEDNNDCKEYSEAQFESENDADHQSNFEVVPAEEQSRVQDYVPP